MRWIGHGHPAIRATHGKTLELAVDPDITARATCIVAVGSRPDTPLPVAGRVRITITAGGESFTLTARGNSTWDPTGPAVIRRSPQRRPDTLATHADAAAADVPRALVAALRDPQNVVEIVVEREPGPLTAVLFALDPARPDRALAAEQAAADLVVAEDETAARALGERLAHGPVRIDGRILVVATRDLPGRTVAAGLATAEIETVHLPSALAAAAAAPTRGPVLVVPDGTDPRDALRRTPAGTRIVLSASAREVGGLLRLAEQLRGPVTAVVAGEFTSPMRVDAESGAALAGTEPVHVCLVAAGEQEQLDPPVRAAIAGLLADGVPTKTVANALAELTGWPRRRAYDAVVSWPR